MRIRLDEAFVGGAWPGPGGLGGASAGEAWVGPGELLGLLETALGLAVPREAFSARVAALVPRVRGTRGFWSESAEVDPLSTSRRLLEWRDTLHLHGWRGQAVSPRLGALAELTQGLTGAPADRLLAVRDALGGVGQVLETLMLHEPVERLPWAWREVCSALAARGARLKVEALADAPATGDLLAARSPGFVPQREGSLQLIRPTGPLEAAEEVAAALAALPSLEGVVLIGADTLLDTALRRHGLPTTGARPRPEDNALFQVLPLTLALGWWPCDPHRALELLTLPMSPVPRGIAHRLAEALHERPAVGSDAWNTALAAGLAVVPEEARERLVQRLAVLFDSPVRGTHYPVTEIRRRVELLQHWLRGHLSRSEEGSDALQTALGQCLSFERLVSLSQLDALAPAQLRRFVEESTAETTSGPLYPAEAGLTAVAEPGAVAGPATHVVWWSFLRDSAPRVTPLGLAPGEVAALARAGVQLPRAEEQARGFSERWARPLSQATRSLLLVCPRVGREGLPVHPHPLWHEIEARLAGGQSSSRLVSSIPWSSWASPPQPREALALVRPQHHWRVEAGLLEKRERESPSGVSALLSCTLQYALRYQGRLNGGETSALTEGDRLLGVTAHALLEKVLSEAARPDTAEEAEALAATLFDSEGPRLAAPLFLPGAVAEKARARQVTMRAAKELFRLIQTGGFEVESVEQEVTGAALDTELAGTPDLVLRRGTSRAILDFKWDGLKYRRRSLQEGTAHQLATYGHLLRASAGGPPVSTGFFILRSQRLLTTDATLAPGAHLEGPAAPQTWSAVEVAHRESQQRMASGELSAPGLPERPELPVRDEDSLTEGRLLLEPPCRFCEYGALCGRTFGGM